MHNRFDRYIKDLLRELLTVMGRVETEVEVALDAQRIDLCFMPAAPGSRPPDELGLLGRMAETASIIEAFHAPPTFNELRGCIRKLLNWHHVQLLRAKQERTRQDAAAATDPSGAAAAAAAVRPTPAPRAAPAVRPASAARAAQPALPVLWVISSGRSVGALKGFALRPAKGWPRGVYASPQPAVPMRLVVVNELPEVRSTLLLRLMGRGAVFRRALRELARLPPDAWERQHAAPFLIGLRTEIEEARASDLLEEEKELIVTGQEIYDSLINQGKTKGLRPLVHLFVRKLGRPLTDDEQATIVQRLDTMGPDRLGDAPIDFEAEELAAWLADPHAR